MSGERRPDGPHAISSADAERLLAGVAPGLDDSPLLTTLHEIFAATRRAGGPDELRDAPRFVAAFSAARSPARETCARHDPLHSITRRTIAIIGIATGASLGAAFATGAVGNPFTAPAPVDRGPAATWHPVEPIEPPSTTAEDPTVATASIAPVVTTASDTAVVAAETATTQPPNADPAGSGNEGDPPATAPGRTGQSPSATAPGQTGDRPSVTAPGHTGNNPSATAPGHTGNNPSATAPGHTGNNPSATAPGHTGDS